MTSNKESASKPWYREPWPWFIIGLLGATVAAGFITLWIAMTNPDFQVVDEEEYQRIKSELRAQSESEGEAQSQPAEGDG